MVRDGYNSITLDDETMKCLRNLQKEGNYQTIPETIRGLLSNSQHEIFNKIELLTTLVDPERNPFSYLMLEIGASKKQIEAVFALMDKTEADIRKKREVSHGDFEKGIYYIFPDQRGNYHLAESIVGILGQQGRWTVVCEYMKKNGMNPSNM